MSFDAVFSGFPTPPYPAASSTVALGVDKNTGALWTTARGGWQPSSNAASQSNSLAVSAANASILVFTVPSTGLYRLDAYVAQATATAVTATGAITATYTEGDTSAAITAQTVLASGATTTLGQSLNGSIIINAKAGTSVTLANAAPTGGTVNIKVRLEPLG